MTEETTERSRPSSPPEAATLGVVRLADRLSHHMKTFFRQYDLTEPQFNVLRILYVANAPMPSHAIAKKLITRVPDVPRLLDRLEKAGWIARERSGGDRRVVDTKLTEKGEALVTEIGPELQLMHQESFVHLSHNELTQLCALLDRALEWTPKEW